MIMIFMKTAGENILYYDAIANEYNNMLDKNLDKDYPGKSCRKSFAILLQGLLYLTLVEGRAWTFHG